MYAIVATGGKQYRVAPGDKINIEKIDAEPGTQVELNAICVIDDDHVEVDAKKAAATKVIATVLQQFKDEKQLVFKFKKRKSYHRLNGHRQRLTQIYIGSVGSDKAAPAPALKTSAPEPEIAAAAPEEEPASHYEK